MSIVNNFWMPDDHGDVEPIELPVKVEKRADLRERLRTVAVRSPIVTGVKFPYETCDIKFSHVAGGQLTSSLDPAQLYVLKSNIDKLQHLYWAFKEAHNIDILYMEGYWLELTYADGRTSSILPPIVELSTGERIICDGMHRCYLAYILRTSIATVDIYGPSLPYYALPNPNGWRDVKEIDKLEKNTRKKYYRFSKYKAYYRDFNTAFPYVGESRKVSA